MVELNIDRQWDEPVILEAGERVLRVQSTRDALLCLKNHWRSPGPARQAAMSGCEAALAGDASPDAALEAFLDAASEAGFRVSRWPREDA
ncbi:DUF982 domain-containing protein [Sinorhizobium alkalisoli]|uniref:Uncharacterized protein n=1 Tax=Sinorhizobium alkalisoli TaxID=1752398 RepID=A0A1E3VI21_9HYPH|nr:DUF982 domain-containing protein [Sinorhizobium alkalisoli]MCA1494710.1 DUF982 domain-containing protein [Ensifer sp. NBAIM29]MCG5480225.1 DUF982 domain-containing protein [Sinorhizobium alkalisoli]ODR93225.1 hypothetical protein A8M32_00935 [Sinorhizobium alkalisoli]QFI69995.1 hypothetical protein EKH55_5121 [Sinorhizobium alkalisoli]